MQDENLREHLDDMFAVMMKDDEKGRELKKNGCYAERNLSEKKLNSQDVFYQRAYDAVER